MKTKLRKGYTLTELVITIAIIGILASVGVGIYFGIASKDISYEQAIEKQKTVVELWEDYLNDGSSTSSLDNKAAKFCLEEAPRLSVTQDLTYRVLDYQPSSSRSTDQEYNSNSSVSRAVDDDLNRGEVAIIKIEDEKYPSYFISSALSVLEVSDPALNEIDFANKLVRSKYVTESTIMKYHMDKKPTDIEYDVPDPTYEDINNIFDIQTIELADGTTTRGFRYVEYTVKDKEGKNDFTNTFVGRANRSLSDFDEKYHPDFVFQTDEDGFVKVLIDEFTMSEKDGKTLDEEYVTFTDSNKSLGLNESNKYQHIVEKRELFYEPNYLSDSDNPSGDSGNADPSNPSNPDTGNDDVIVDSGDVDVENYPIVIMSHYKIQIKESLNFWDAISYLFDKGFKGIENLINGEDEYFYYYFRNFETLNIFLESGILDTFIPVNEKGDKIKSNHYYIISTGNLVLNSTLKIGGSSYTVDDENYSHSISLIVDDYKCSTDNRVSYLEGTFKNHYNPEGTNPNLRAHSNNYLRHSSTEFLKSKYIGSAQNTLTIGKNGQIILQNGANLSVEGEYCIPKQGYGYSVNNYGKIINNSELRTGGIVCYSGSQLRCEGLIEGSGKIIARPGSSIAEPFKVCDYDNRETREQYFKYRGSPMEHHAMDFPFEHYYIDSIRCSVDFYDTSEYIMLFGLYNSERDYDSRKNNLTSFNLFKTRDADDSIFASEIGNVTPDNAGVILTKDCDSYQVVNESGYGTNLTFRNKTIEYRSTTIQIQYALQGYFNEQKSFIDTLMSGFSLSNTDITVEKDTTLIFDRHDNSSLDHEYYTGQFDVLPGSSITNKGTLKVANYNQLNICDYYDPNVAINGATYFASFLDGSSRDYGNRYNALYNIYCDNAQKGKRMFVNTGTIDVEFNPSNAWSNKKTSSSGSQKVTAMAPDIESGVGCDGKYGSTPDIQYDCPHHKKEFKTTYTNTYKISNINIWTTINFKGFSNYSNPSKALVANITSNVRQRVEVISDEHVEVYRIRVGKWERVYTKHKYVYDVDIVNVNEYLYKVGTTDVYPTYCYNNLDAKTYYNQ